MIPLRISVVLVEMHPVGPVRTGGWCEPCAKPSLVEQDFVLADCTTLRIGPRATFRVCADCGRRS